MTIRTLVGVIALLCVAALADPATADDDTGTLNGGTTGDGLFVAGAKEGTGSHGPHSAAASHASSDGPRIVLGAAACSAADQTHVGDVTVTFCPATDTKPTQPVLTLGLIRSAFAELRLPAGTLVIQPPDGLTLVNFDTNFYTSSTAPITRTVTLLGRRVTLEATPSRFRWDFGDGGSVTTTKPGAPYPRLDITHRYLRKGTFRPRLDTTYSGRYRVGGGPWRAIPGTVTITGQAQALRTIEAQPKLVSY